MKEKVIIPRTLSVQQAMKILEDSPLKTLFLTDEEGRLCGSLTDGDVRRWILRSGDVNGGVSEACNPSPYILRLPFDKQEIRREMQKRHLYTAPVVDAEGRIESLVHLSDLMEIAIPNPSALASIPVVIMAGGKGTRLDPFTRILPKPLIPIGNQPVIEVIMEELARHGASKFIISLNHKARLIKAYFEDQQYPYEISYIEENQPLGTAGALKMLEGVVEGDLLVSNCDIVIKSDYGEILQFHRNGKFAITVVAAMHNLEIPYGVCETDNKGFLKKITEKPEYSMLINSGMYIIHSQCLSLIPENRLFHITHLIEEVQKAGLPVGVFPIPQSAYHDIGQWDAYHSSLPKLI